MDKIKKYKNEIRKMFFISIKNDLHLWRESITMRNGRGVFIKTYEDYTLKINLKENTLTLSNYSEIIISHYKTWIIPLDFKVWLYTIKMKNHFKQVEKDIDNFKTIDFLKTGLTKIEKDYTKEIRKEKLIQINK